MIGRLYDLVAFGGVPGGIIGLVITAFQLWMFVDAVRRREWIWAVIILIGWGISAVLYYLMVVRPQGAIGNPLAGFELPGAADRRQIARLKSEIHHLDKAHLHLQLGDIYFSQGKLKDAETSYRAAFEREPEDEDTLAHLGTCLERLNRPKEALPLLQAVCARNPKHDYGYTLMTLAETQVSAGENEAALATWRQVLALYQYSRARVQYAELLLKTGGSKEEAARNLDEVIEGEQFSTRFQRKREAVWVRRAKPLRRQIS